MTAQGPYYLSNMFLGQDHHLDILSNNPDLQLSMSPSPGLQFYRNSTSQGEDKICTNYRSIAYCLGIGIDDYPHLEAPASVPGQQWTVTPTETGGYQRISNSEIGDGYHLDTYNDTYQAFMALTDATGQYWLFQPVGLNPMASTASQSPTTSVTTQHPPSQTSASSSTPASSTASYSQPPPPSAVIASSTAAASASASTSNAAATALAASKTSGRLALGFCLAAALSYIWR